MVLPLKLGSADGVRPRPNANCPSLSMPNAFVKISALRYAFADEVIVHFDMFSSGVKHVVARVVDAAHIVTKDANRIHNGNA